MQDQSSRATASLLRLAFRLLRSFQTLELLEQPSRPVHSYNPLVQIE